jgi:hypothetical protein
MTLNEEQRARIGEVAKAIEEENKAINELAKEVVDSDKTNEKRRPHMILSAASRIRQVYPMGRYWVGDPCYVFPQNKWSVFCDTLHGLDDAEQGIDFSYSDRVVAATKFFVCGTRYGDGTYILKQDDCHVMGKCGVDAGLLSVVPEMLVKAWHNQCGHETGGVWVEMSRGFTIEAKDGDFTFGRYSIKTNDDNQENEGENDNE